MPTRRPTILAVSLVLTLTGSLFAQTPLPDDVITSPTLTPTQIRQVTDYAKGFQDDLLSEDDAACQRARKRLADPLTKAAVSLSFRRQYSQQLIGAVQAGSRSPNEHVAVNCLLLAGRLATNEALDVLERSLADERVPVRYAAVAGITLMFAQVNDNAPAIFQDRVEGAVTRLGEVVRDDPSSAVFDAAVRALVAATRQGAFEAVQNTAVNVMTQSVRDRLRTLRHAPDPQTLAGALRAADALRTLLIQDINNQRSAAARNAAELAGHLLAFVAARINEGDFALADGAEPDEQTARARSVAGQLLGLAEATIILVNDDYLGGSPIQPWNLGDAFQAGDAQTVVQTVRNDVIGPRGVLTEAPFTFADDTFTR